MIPLLLQRLIVQITKLKWSTPCDAWKIVKILSSGETIHHENSTIIRMWLPDGITATTDADNYLLLGPHFAKVFCTDRPIDWSALEEVIQRDVMQEIDQTISWDEIKA